MPLEDCGHDGSSVFGVGLRAPPRARLVEAWGGVFQPPVGVWRKHARFATLRLIAAALGFELVVGLRLRRVAA